MPESFDAQNNNNNECNNDEAINNNCARSLVTIQITGRNTKCESAKNKLLSLIPITKSVTFLF